MLYHIMLYYIISYHIISYYNVLYYIILYYIILVGYQEELELCRYPGGTKRATSVSARLLRALPFAWHPSPCCPQNAPNVPLP